jgi:hypothetical protein
MRLGRTERRRCVVGSYREAPKFKDILLVPKIQLFGRVEFESHYAVKLIYSDGDLENLAWRQRIRNRVVTKMKDSADDS